MTDGGAPPEGRPPAWRQGRPPAWRRRGGILTLQVLLAVGVGLGIFAAYGGLGGFFQTFDAGCPDPLCDWHRIYQPAAFAFAQGRTIVPWGYLYPPIFAALTVPFAYLGDGSWLGFLALGHVLLVTVPPHLQAQRPPLAAALVYTLLGSLTVPLWVGLDWGQPASWILLLAVLGAVLRPGWLWAGLLALAAAIKVYPVIVAGIFVFRRDGRGALVAVGVAVLALVVLPLVWLGPAGSVEYYQAVYAELARTSEMIRFYASRMSFMAVCARFVGDYGTGVPYTIFSGIGMVLAGGQVGLAWLEHRRGGRAGALGAVIALYGVFPFVLPTSWSHYFVHLPLLWWVVAMRPAEGQRFALLVRVLLGASIVLVLVPTYAVLGASLWVVVGAPLWAHVAGTAAQALTHLRSGEGRAGAIVSAPPPR